MSKTIIERMCSIAEKMRPDEDSSQMAIGRMSLAMTDIRSLAKTLDMSAMQVVILTAIVRRSSRYRIEGSDVADTLGLDYLKFLTYNNEMEGLRKRGYLRIDKDGDIVIPKSVLNCLKNNSPVKPLPTTGLSSEELLTRIDHALDLRDEDQCTTDELIEDLNSLMEQNPTTSVSRGIRKIQKKIPWLENVVLYGLVYRYYFEDDDMVGWHDLDDYVSEDELNRLKSRYRREILSLQQEGVIEYTGRNGLIDKDFFRITNEYKEEIFEDVGGVRKKEKTVSASRKLDASGIGPKELFYNMAEGRQVAQLKELMSEKRFGEIREKMKAKGLRTGFTCLFYGSPGTGKTETVYQIARECGRDLYIVDVSQVKSCWVGESEKNIKDVFDKYRQAVRGEGPVPILLFNEADAIFGIRQEGAERAVDKMENSIQNIILQEMEDLDGILIATTNLTTNLDKAFERRFLYKIRFDKPSLEARVAIWRSMIPSLSEAEAVQLATDFDFSGGQIENIARKREVQSIIGLCEPGFAQVREFCTEEIIGNEPSRRRIGF